MPILNVDGVNFIEENWKIDHKIKPERKNMNPNVNCASSDPVDNGVDLNRNFAIDFGQVDNTVEDLLADEWTAPKPK